MNCPSRSLRWQKNPLTSERDNTPLFGGYNSTPMLLQESTLPATPSERPGETKLSPPLKFSGLSVSLPPAEYSRLALPLGLGYIDILCKWVHCRTSMIIKTTDFLWFSDIQDSLFHVSYLCVNSRLDVSECLSSICVHSCVKMRTFLKVTVEQNCWS